DASSGGVIQVWVGQVCGAAHARAIAGERGGDVLVDGAGGGALGIELGIVLVGLHQGSIYRARARARPDEARAIAVLPAAVLPAAVLPTAVLPSVGLPRVGLPTAVLPTAGLPVASLPSGDPLSGDLRRGKRREQKAGACGKRCNPRRARSRSPSQSPPPHAQTPAPALPPNAVAALER